MDKLRNNSRSVNLHGGEPTVAEQQQHIEQYPRNLIEQYLRASNKVKKIERVVFKRFAPNVSDVQADFQRLAYNFEESGIMQYAAMCHIGFAKCESYGGLPQREAEAYMKAARDFLVSHNEFGMLHLRTAHNGFKEGAAHCYNKAAECVVDGGVMKAALLRELKQLQRQLERTSAFASPTHRINDLEMAADASMQRGDYLNALQQLDDIVDNIYERKCAPMYAELLRQVEVLRVLLLVHLSLPPARQSPSHIKLIDYYYSLALFEQDLCNGLPREQGSMDMRNNSATQLHRETFLCLKYNNELIERPGAFVSEQQQYALAEIICAWVARKMCDLKFLLKDFAAEFRSVSTTERHLLKTIYSDLCKSY